MAVIKMNFLSQALGMQTNITICLPTYSFADAVADRREVYVPGMKYQVLWLLHGGSGDDSDYLNFSNIARYADENKIAVVMPAGYDSFYTNWHEGCDGAQYYTYITEELFHTLPILFPFSTKREDNFVAGLSRGSHGAMKIAINHPERYAAALIMSGSAIRPKNIAQGLDTVAEHSGPLPTILKRITRLQQEDFVKGTENDVNAIAVEKARSGQPLSQFFITCGGDDFALEGTKYGSDYLKELGYNVYFEEIPGYVHEWDFWDLALRKALKEWLPLRRSILYPGRESV